MDLITAVKQKKREDAKAIIASGVDLNATDALGNNALTWAVITNSDELVELILHQTELNNQDRRYITAAIENHSNENGYSTLLWACRKNNTKAAAAFLTYGPDVNTHGEDGTYPLFWAIKNNNTEMAKLLLESGADPNPPIASGRDDDEDEPPRHIWEIVIRNDRHEMAEILLAHGTNPDTSFVTKVSRKSAKADWTPLQLACRRNRTRLALLLAERTGRVSLQVENVEGNTPLGSAVLHKNTDLVFGLMRLGADPLHAGREQSPFIKACQLGYLGIVAIILQEKPSICSSSALVEAILGFLRPTIQPNTARRRHDIPRRPKMVDLLLNHGGNVYELFYQTMHTITPSQLALLVRAGLDHEVAMEQLVKSSMEGKDRWMLGLVVKASPYACSDWYDEFQEKFADADQAANVTQGKKEKKKKAKERKSFLAQLYDVAHKPPSLIDISIRVVRIILSRSNEDGNILPLLRKGLRGIIPELVFRQLRLTNNIPLFFQAEVDAFLSASGGDQVDRGQEETREEDTDSSVHLQKARLECFSSAACTYDVPEWGLVESSEEFSYVQSLFSSDQNEIIKNAPQLNCFLEISQLCPKHKSSQCSVEARLTQMTKRFLHVILFKLKGELGLDFALLPCGSVHAGNKMGPFDEIDFILRWNISGEVKISKVENGRLFATFFSPCDELTGGVKELLYQFVRDQIEKGRDTLVECGLVVEACYMYNKAPAVCFRMSWTCVYGHNHVISVDLTPCLIFTNHKLGSFCQHREKEESAFGDIMNHMLEAPLSLVLEEGQIFEDGSYFTSPWQVSTNICDWQIFKMLDHISPNIRKVYQLLKTVRDAEFPKHFKHSGENKTFELRWRDGQLVSSHVLKNIVLEEVEKNHEKHCWESQFLHDRMLSCLQRVRKNQYKEAISGEHDHIVQARGLPPVSADHLHKCLEEDVSHVMGLLEKNGIDGILVYGAEHNARIPDDILMIELPKNKKKSVKFCRNTLSNLRSNDNEIRSVVGSTKTAIHALYFYGPSSRRIRQASDE